MNNFLNQKYGDKWILSKYLDLFEKMFKNILVGLLNITMHFNVLAVGLRWGGCSHRMHDCEVMT